jgi:hypothetical protein
MSQQEATIMPLDAYSPISTFDAADRRKHALPTVNLPVMSMPEPRRNAREVALLSHVSFLREVEQVWLFAGCVARGEIDPDLVVSGWMLLRLVCSGRLSVVDLIMKR